MKKCHVCKDKVAEFKNLETGNEVCEECMNKEVDAAKAANMTEPTFEAIAIEAEPAENQTTEAPAAEEPVEGAEVVDEAKDAAPETKKEQNFSLRDVPPEVETIEVKCSYCGKTGHAGDIEDDHGVRYGWHNLPTDMNGEGAVEAVCLKCAKEHDKQHKKRFQRWFSKHRTLPVLAYTLMGRSEANKKKQALMDKARQWGKDHGIEEDDKKVCSVCGLHHGQLVETDVPYFHYLVTSVDTVVGTPANRQEMANSLLCRDCRREALDAAKANGVYLKLRNPEEMDEEFDRRDRLAKAMGKGVEQRFEPIGSQKGDGRRQKRDQWRKTG